MLALLVALTIAAPPTPKPKPSKTPAAVDAGVPGQLEQAGELKEIELDEKRARAVYRIHTSPAIPAVIDLPERFTFSCGDCVDIGGAGAQGANSAALFAVKWESRDGTNVLTIKPRTTPGTQPDGTVIAAADFVTTLTIRLQSLTVTLQVEFTDSPRLADARVRFTLPGRAAETRFIMDSVAKAKAQLEADFAKRVEAAAAEHLLRSILEPHECRSANARARADDMVLEVKELCRFGPQVYVRFALENRGRSLFAVGDVAAGVGDGKTYAPAETHSLLTLQEVAFQQAAEGVVSFQLEDPNAHSFELRLPERGGRNRIIELQNFSF
jgi:hypothetical protein